MIIIILFAHTNKREANLLALDKRCWFTLSHTYTHSQLATAHRNERMCSLGMDKLRPLNCTDNLHSFLFAFARTLSEAIKKNKIRDHRVVFTRRKCNKKSGDAQTKPEKTTQKMSEFKSRRKKRAIVWPNAFAVTGVN